MRVVASWDGQAEDLAFRLSKFTRFSLQPANANDTINALLGMYSSRESFRDEALALDPGALAVFENSCEFCLVVVLC